MNTFLPSPDFEKCALVLDNKRLNKQLVEGVQVCKIIVHHLETRAGYGWLNHPVWKLWWSDDGHCLLPELVHYLDTLSEEWHKRPGTRKRHRWTEHATQFKGVLQRPLGVVTWPSHVHVSHRRNLMRKDPSHYCHYFRLAGLPIEGPMEGYFWEHPQWSAT